MTVARITCVIPTYRRPQLLRRALNSVLNQTCRDLIVKVFDNASGDETEAVVREFAQRDARVSYHCHDRNIGAPANFAFALRDIHTPYFSVLADDDVLLPTLYASAVEALERYREAMFYCSRTITDDRLNGALRHGQAEWRDGLHQPSSEVVARMIRQHFTSTGVVFRREIQDSVGPFASYASDKSYDIVASATHPFVVDTRERAVFTLHAQSFSAGIAAVDRTPHDAAFVLQILQETSAGLEQTPFAPTRDAMLRDVLLANARREAFYSVLFKSVPRARWGSIEFVLAADELRLGNGQKFVLRFLRALGRTPVIASILAMSARAATVAFGIARGLADRRGSDRAVEQYLRSDCSNPDVLTGV